MSDWSEFHLLSAIAKRKQADAYAAEKAASAISCRLFDHPSKDAHYDDLIHSYRQMADDQDALHEAAKVPA